VSFSTIRLLVGCLMLVEGAIGIIWSRYWEKYMPGLNIRRIGFIECIAAISILAMHFLVW